MTPIETALRVMPDIEIVRQTRKGKGNALACGFAAVTGDIVVMFDADGSADPKEIPAFVQALVDGADVAKGSRFAPGGEARTSPASARSATLASTGSRTSCSAPGTPTSATATTRSGGHGARLATCRLATWAVWSDDGLGRRFRDRDCAQLPLLPGGARIVEVPSVEKSRSYGESNLNAIRDGFRVLRNDPAERTTRPVRHRPPRRGPRTRSTSADLDPRGARKAASTAELQQSSVPP